MAAFYKVNRNMWCDKILGFSFQLFCNSKVSIALENQDLFLQTTAAAQP
jgi:hypothetical protein